MDLCAQTITLVNTVPFAKGRSTLAGYVQFTQETHPFLGLQ